jgi:hypothetical protein
MHYLINTELSSHEETRCQFNGSTGVIKLGIEVHQEFYVVVMQVDGSNPKPSQRFSKEAFLHWAARLKRSDGYRKVTKTSPFFAGYLRLPRLCSEMFKSRSMNASLLGFCYVGS